jgi:hypothetical protein
MHKSKTVTFAGLVVTVAAAVAVSPAWAGEGDAPPDPSEESVRQQKAEALAHFMVQGALQDAPKYQIAGASTAICYFSELRKQIRDEIKTEKRYAAEGAGIINMEKMYELQRELRYIDEAVATIRSDLTDRGAKPLACPALLVQKGALCVGWRVMNTFPQGNSPDAVEHFCSSDEMRAMVELVNLGEKAPYWSGANQAIINLSYELDRAHLVARSAEVCIGTKYAPLLDSKLKNAKPADRAIAERFLLMLNNGRRELEQAGLQALACDEPLVRQLITCVMEKGDDVGVKPGCRSPELKDAMGRLWRE